MTLPGGEPRTMTSSPCRGGGVLSESLSTGPRAIRWKPSRTLYGVQSSNFRYRRVGLTESGSEIELRTENGQSGSVKLHHGSRLVLMPSQASAWTSQHHPG